MRATAWSISSTATRAWADRARSRSAVDGDRAPLARLLVELDVARLTLLGQRVGLRLEIGGLLQVDGALAHEQLPLLVEELALLGVRPDRRPSGGLGPRRRAGLGLGGSGRGLGLLRRGLDRLGGRPHRPLAGALRAAVVFLVAALAPLLAAALGTPWGQALAGALAGRLAAALPAAGLAVALAEAAFFEAAAGALALADGLRPWSSSPACAPNWPWPRRGPPSARWPSWQGSCRSPLQPSPTGAAGREPGRRPGAVTIPEHPRGGKVGAPVPAAADRMDQARSPAGLPAVRTSGPGPSGRPSAGPDSFTASCPCAGPGPVRSASGRAGGSPRRRPSPRRAGAGP